jgi:hypothetical protein
MTTTVLHGSEGSFVNRLIRSTAIAVIVVCAQVAIVDAQPSPTPAEPPPTTPTTPPPTTTPDQPPPTTTAPTTPTQPATTAPPPVTAQPAPPVEPPPAPEPEVKSFAQQFHRNFAGSIQLDYMAIPTENTGRKIALDGATAEVSLKLAMDFNNKITSSVKVCVACHGFEVASAYFDLRAADELNFRVGRFTPAFGDFPVRYDPANHRTSDKPLIYDMGRMLRITEWNEGILPSPWVDNGLEINGTHFFGQHLQTDYAVYAIGGPRGDTNPVDFDFKLSRDGNSYYIDNNSRPVIGGQLAASVITDDATVTGGVSAMAGTYDPAHELPFQIYGAHLVFRIKDVFLRAEYVTRRTKMYMGPDPAMNFKYGAGPDGVFDPYFSKDGGYVEFEAPITSRVTVVLREDGMRRRGNVETDSLLRSDSAVLRHTAGLAIGIYQSLRLKLSYEYYDFSDFKDEQVIHVGIAGPF